MIDDRLISDHYKVGCMTVYLLYSKRTQATAVDREDILLRTV